MNNGWHKCFLCDCEYFDESTPGYWGWCRDCRKIALKEEKPSSRPQAPVRPTLTDSKRH